jgi:hypothetical protein
LSLSHAVNFIFCLGPYGGSILAMEGTKNSKYLEMRGWPIHEFAWESPDVISSVEPHSLVALVGNSQNALNYCVCSRLDVRDQTVA